MAEKTFFPRKCCKDSTLHVEENARRRETEAAPSCQDERGFAGFPPNSSLSLSIRLDFCIRSWTWDLDSNSDSQYGKIYLRYSGIGCIL